MAGGPRKTQASVRAFISYAHDDAAHEDLVRDFWWFLRAQGVDAQADLLAAEDRQDWAGWMSRQVREAERVLVVASPAYRRRAEGDALPGEGRGVQWEARLIRDRLYADQQAGLQLVLPVLLPGCSVVDLPSWLAPASATHYVVSEFTVAGAEALLRVLTGQPLQVEPPLGEIPFLPPHPTPFIGPPSCHVIIWTGVEAIRERAAKTLQSLGLNPAEEWCTARAVSYRISSSQTRQVQDRMERTDFRWTVVPPGLEDYLVRQLYFEGPDGNRFRLFDTPAHESIESLIEEAISQQRGSSRETVSFTVLDEIGPSGQVRRLDPNETLHMAGVRDGDLLRIYSEFGERKEGTGHVFISYAREDADNANRLQQALEAAGIWVWRDSADIRPGEEWRTAIRRAITHEALVFIACFSRRSVALEESYQNEELYLAAEQLRARRRDDVWLISVRFDDCEIPDFDIGRGETLDAIQWVDLFGNDFEKGSSRLVETIQHVLARRLHRS